MTSILGGTGDDEPAQPWVFYLTVVGEQALIALRHLESVWAMEGEPADVNAWARRDLVDESAVWSHLQGAMFAGIVLARMFDPRIPRPSARASAAKRAHHQRMQETAQTRAAKLRQLLDVETDSQLLQIRGVRDAIEHFDEKIDELVIAGDVASVSDFHIALGGQFAEVSAEEAISQGGKGFRHVTLRQFAPDIGILYFGKKFVDLFAYEAALHSLLASIPEAYAQVAPSSEKRTLFFGVSQLTRWNENLVASRRSAIADVRKRVREADQWLLHPASRPRTVVAVWDMPPTVPE